MNKSDPSKNDGTAKVIVLLPRDDDPVRQIASGDHPHTTLFYLGDGETDMEALKDLVKVAADLGHTYPDPFDMIAGEGTLGVEGAHVYFLDARFSEKVRSQMEDDPWLQNELEKAEQFPMWTPHMTIGYPDAPAERVSERPDGIVYDRIAIFDQGEVIEYPFDFTDADDQPEEEPESESVTASAEVEEDEELAAAVAELQENEDDVAVPIKGILAPEGVPSSDNRMFSEGALTAREVPIPLRWVEKDSGGHDNAVIVGRMDKIFREDGVIKFQGVMDTSASAYEAVRLIANGMLRGVSVDVSDVVAAEGDDEVTEFSSAKIAAATLVAIPAFSEAFVSLGYWDEDEEEDQEKGEFAISEKSWDGSASRFTEEEYHRSCLIHEHPDGEPSKSACKLPIREPNGDINKNGVHAAASRIDQVDASEEEKSKAKSKLKSAYKEIGEEPPEQFADVQFADKLLPKHMDGPGWITEPKPTKRITSYWVDGRGAAKIRWGQGGDFNRCRRQLAKYVKNPDWLAGLCFTGDTEFTTADGVMTFEEAADTVQKVLTSADPTGEKGSGQKRKGRWVEAPIESFGEHEVMTVRLRRNRTVKEVRATRNHIWFAQEHPNNLQNSPMKQVKTEDLRPGSVLASLMPEPTVAKGRSAPSPIGISAGMVFGDGTAAKDNTGASIDLWGEKDANLLPYFSMQSMKDRTNVNGLPGKRVYGLPNSWKRPPQLDEGFSYLYGWLAGYFAADGSVTKRGAASISSANKEHLEYAATVARKLGISVQPIGKQMRKGKGAEEAPLYKLGFVGNTLHEDFFIIPEHRENWAGVPHSRSAVRWTVEEVVETGEVEEVFCAVVPETENFVLTDTIWVHNCANMHHRALGIWPGQHSLESSVIASASPSVTFVAPSGKMTAWNAETATKSSIDGEAKREGSAETAMTSASSRESRYPTSSAPSVEQSSNLEEDSAQRSGAESVRPNEIQSFSGKQGNLGTKEERLTEKRKQGGAKLSEEEKSPTQLDGGRTSSTRTSEQSTSKHYTTGREVSAESAIEKSSGQQVGEPTTAHTSTTATTPLSSEGGSARLATEGLEHFSTARNSSSQPSSGLKSEEKELNSPKSKSKRGRVPLVEVPDHRVLPAEWFRDPQLKEPTPLTITEEGRIWAHLASWQVCHIGFTDDCVIAPRSITDYSYFRTGEVDTTEGPVAVGNIVMGGPHADPKAKMRAAFVHYASTSSALADVNVGEDEHGIWISGALRDSVSADDLRSLKASGLSGDWRHVRANGQANLELVAALAVNVQGFPIPRPSLAASGETKESLVAASPVVDTHKVMNRARISEARSTLRAHRAAMLKTEIGL